MAKIGDQIRFLNSVGGGRIVKIKGNIAYVDEDGFETPVLLKECVVVSPAQDAESARKAAGAEPDRAPAICDDDAEPEHRAISKPAQRKAQSEPLVIDLHIGELVDSVVGLSNGDMLNLQVSKFRQVMDENLRHHGQKIVFIHGKGEGVLRKALLNELATRYKEHEAQDASFREYGFGATQVKIK